LAILNFDHQFKILTNFDNSNELRCTRWTFLATHSFRLLKLVKILNWWSNFKMAKTLVWQLWPSTNQALQAQSLVSPVSNTTSQVSEHTKTKAPMNWRGQHNAPFPCCLSETENISGFSSDLVLLVPVICPISKFLLCYLFISRIVTKSPTTFNC
jgi:hypothetical protein